MGSLKHLLGSKKRLVAFTVK